MTNHNFKMRCSALHNIMTMPRAVKDRGELSQGGKTYIRNLAKQTVFGYYPEINSKYMDKGTAVEDDSIDLLNSVQFTNYVKNSERFNSDNGLTGEPDLITDTHIIDIKSAWNIDTFPVFQDEAQDYVKKSGYDWQCKAYCMLTGRVNWSVAICLVDTPDELISQWDQMDLHKVQHIDPVKRVRIVSGELTQDDVEMIDDRLKVAREYFDECIKELN